MRATFARTRAERWMRAAGTLRHTPLVSDGRGGQTPGTPEDTAIVCNIRTTVRTATEQTIADRLAGRAVYFIDMPVDVPATNADQIIVGGRTFEIEEVIEQTIQAQITAVCVEE